MRRRKKVVTRTNVYDCSFTKKERKKERKKDSKEVKILRRSRNMKYRHLGDSRGKNTKQKLNKSLLASIYRKMYLGQAILFLFQVTTYKDPNLKIIN
jgi:hypothetical protein